MAGRSPEEQAQVDASVHRLEEHFKGLFGGMETDKFIDQGVSIFRAGAEGIPTVNPAADEAVRVVLKALVTGEAPVPFMGGRTAAAWRMYTSVLVGRAAEIDPESFREVPLVYENVQLPPDLGGVPEDEYRERLIAKWQEIQSPNDSA